MAQTIRTLPMEALARIPYEHGTIAIHWLVTRPLFRQWLFYRQVRLLEQTLDELSINPDPGDLITHNLAANVLRFYRLSALARCNGEQFERWIRIEGLETLSNIKAKGQGVIVVNSHTCLAHLLTLVLHRVGHDDLYTVGDDIVKLKLFGIKTPSTSPIADDKDLAFLQQLQSAKLILRNGGLVQIAADGSYGASGINAQLFGRKRFFRSGFAELAALTRAEIIPVLVTMQPDGMVRVRFETPLERTPRQPSRVLVENLMRQYIEFNRSIWRERLGDLKWRQLERFLALPRWDT